MRVLHPVLDPSVWEDGHSASGAKPGRTARAMAGARRHLGNGSLLVCACLEIKFVSGAAGIRQCLGMGKAGHTREWPPFGVGVLAETLSISPLLLAFVRTDAFPLVTDPRPGNGHTKTTHPPTRQPHGGDGAGWGGFPLPQNLFVAAMPDTEIPQHLQCLGVLSKAGTQVLTCPTAK